jgi:hypothetical protein
VAVQEPEAQVEFQEVALPKEMAVLVTHGLLEMVWYVVVEGVMEL